MRLTIFRKKQPYEGGYASFAPLPTPVAPADYATLSDDPVSTLADTPQSMINDGVYNLAQDTGNIVQVAGNVSDIIGGDSSVGETPSQQKGKQETPEEKEARKEKNKDDFCEKKRDQIVEKAQAVRPPKDPVTGKRKGFEGVKNRIQQYLDAAYPPEGFLPFNDKLHFDIIKSDLTKLQKLIDQYKNGGCETRLGSVPDEVTELSQTGSLPVPLDNEEAEKNREKNDEERKRRRQQNQSPDVKPASPNIPAPDPNVIAPLTVGGALLTILSLLNPA